MERDYGGKKQKQAARVQDAHATQLDHVDPWLGRSGRKR